jgi:CheY-like chemotaxis protein
MQRQPLRILVIDDDPDMVQSLALLAVGMGHDVQRATSGWEALRVARRTRPEIVLLDLGLPDIDGYAIARQLRREPALARTRIVAITGHAREEDRKRSLDAGCDEHLVKPVDPAVLDRLLNPAP